MNSFLLFLNYGNNASLASMQGTPLAKGLLCVWYPNTVENEDKSESYPVAQSVYWLRSWLGDWRIRIWLDLPHRDCVLTGYVAQRVSYPTGPLSSEVKRPRYYAIHSRPSESDANGQERRDLELKKKAMGHSRLQYNPSPVNYLFLNLFSNGFSATQFTLRGVHFLKLNSEIYIFNFKGDDFEWWIGKDGEGSYRDLFEAISQNLPG
jgi:hypothetical protein